MILVKDSNNTLLFKGCWQMEMDKSVKSNTNTVMNGEMI